MFRSHLISNTKKDRGAGEKMASTAMTAILAFQMLLPVSGTVPGRAGERTSGRLTTAAAASPTDEQQPVMQYAESPLSFEAIEKNRFLAHGKGYAISLTPDGASFSLRRANNSQGAFHTIQMRPIGVKEQRELNGETQLPGQANYLIGNDPQSWRRNIPTYARVKQDAVWPGIDLVWYGKEKQMEYDFIVSPGADPKTIRLEITGAKKMRIDSNGDLVLSAGKEELRQQRPFIYQEADGQRKEISGSFVLHSQRQFGFEVGSYDVTRPLIIDPTFAFSTYLGGSGEDDGRGITTDGSGNVYVVGSTSATIPSPVLNAPAGSGDAFVCKYDSSGAKQWAAYVGGTDVDTGAGIAVDSTGEVWITGTTSSTNFPLANAYQSVKGTGSDAFVTRLSSNGASIIYSSYLGGNNSDSGNGITVDSNNKNAYIVGQTLSSNFPTKRAFQTTLKGISDAFVTRINTNAAGLASLFYSTYLGGTSTEAAQTIVLGPRDSASSPGEPGAYVVGSTSSTDFPVHLNFYYQNTYQGISDAFLVRVGVPLGTGANIYRGYSSYLGGNDQDEGYGLAVDSSGNAYVSGYTASTNFPVKSAYQGTFNGGLYDGFVSKLNTLVPFSNPGALVYSTYLGGSGEDDSLDVAIDSSGNAYVTGSTTSFSPNVGSGFFPILSAVDATAAGPGEAYVTRLNASGNALVWSSFLGGSGDEYSFGVAVGSTGYVCVAGLTYSTNFPTQSPAQAASGGNSDAFVVRINP